MNDVKQALGKVHALPTEPGPALGATPGDPTGLGPHDMYELAIHIPMSSFTTTPNDDPRIDQVVHHARDLFPAASATGGFAWPEDGPVQCPTCGAVDRAERRHRAHVDAETTLRELVRWLTTERDRLHTEHRRDASREPGPMIEARTLRIVLDRLRDQGLDVDYLAEPDTREQT